MQTIKDLIDFLSKLDGDYPIPYVDKIVGANQDEKQVKDYSVTWTNDTSCVKCYVDCSFFEKECDDYFVSIYFTIPKPDCCQSVSYNYAISDENFIYKLEECLRELYDTN